MKSISVTQKNKEQASSVWYEPESHRLVVLFGSIVRAIRLDLMPVRDFESEAAIERFSLGQNASVVVCHHEDGNETWLPVDMWWPGGFTPPASKPRGRKGKVISDVGVQIKSLREKYSLSQREAARIGGVPQRTLEGWERGTGTPPPDRLDALIKRIEEQSAPIQRKRLLNFRSSTNIFALSNPAKRR